MFYIAAVNTTSNFIIIDNRIVKKQGAFVLFLVIER
jgi:hypothetical protein